MTPHPAPPESVGLSEKRYFTFASAESPMRLESGATLGPVTLAYETFGEPNEARDNAILILHALTGDSHAAGFYTRDDRKPGWWDNMIGPGKAFDTRRYWVICANAIGGCQGSTGPSSMNPATGASYGATFPMVTIGDIVDTQHALMTHLGITQWHSLAGGSLGGFQALEWMLRYPQAVASAICVASAARLSAQGIAFNAVGRHAIINDPNWREGAYYETGPGPDIGLATARMLGHITYLSELSLERKFGRKLQWADRIRYDFAAEFAVESYLHHQGQRFIERFDANSYLYLTKAMDYFDLRQKYGPLQEAFARIQASALVIAYSSDWLFPVEQSREIANALKQNRKDVTFVTLDSDYGHDAFLLETAQMTRLIQSFLNKVETVKRMKSEAFAAHGVSRPPIVFEPPGRGSRSQRLPFGL
ncbi:MAG: homoserine O-acetyltransferase [Vampirovibrionales bacterium]|nr:homoserine O-acetyltransferase [Vampirovibrionales bacterium]